jgi:hypothetical protein
MDGDRCDAARKLQPHVLYWLSHLSCIILAAQEDLAIARSASPLAYFIISPEILPVPPFLSSIHRT